MSFKRLETSDFVISADSISSTLWSTQTPSLTNFFTSSAQIAGSSGQFYYNVYQTASFLANAEIQFAVAYGNKYGSGSLNYSNLIDGYSPSSTVYGQWQNLIIGDENTDFVFGGVSSSNFVAITFERTRYKESLLPGSLLLTLGSGPNALLLKDSSEYTNTATFTEAGRVFNLITASSTNDASTYGWFLPDISSIILNTGTNGVTSSLSAWSGSASGSNAPNESPMKSIIDGLTAGGNFKINSQETITSNYIFIRAKSSEFNYSENPSFISGSTGEILNNSFINNPQTYITTVGLYNDTNELLAVAKLSRPLPKDFTSEALIRVKLDF